MGQCRGNIMRDIYIERELVNLAIIIIIVSFFIIPSDIGCPGGEKQS